MRFIVAFPLLLLVLIAYNVMAFWEPGSLWAEAIRVNMMSGASLALHVKSRASEDRIAGYRLLAFYP